MKGKKMSEQIIEQLTEIFKQDFDLIKNNLGTLEQAVKERLLVEGS